MSRRGKLTIIGAIGSVALSTTAQAACWTPAAADAAQVRDLQSRLMVAALRCGKSGHNLLPEYNKFVNAKRPILKQTNRVLKGHFAKGRANRQALNHYDRFATSLANKYGAGTGNLSECKAMKRLTQTASESGNQFDSLVQISRDHGLAPNLPGGRCTIVMAAKSKR